MCQDVSVSLDEMRVTHEVEAVARSSSPASSATAATSERHGWSLRRGESRDRGWSRLRRWTERPVEGEIGRMRGRDRSWRLRGNALPCLSPLVACAPPEIWDSATTRQGAAAQTPMLSSDVDERHGSFSGLADLLSKFWRHWTKRPSLPSSVGASRLPRQHPP